jgi:Zn-finger protein
MTEEKRRENCQQLQCDKKEVCKWRYDGLYEQERLSNARWIAMRQGDYLHGEKISDDTCT